MAGRARSIFRSTLLVLLIGAAGLSGDSRPPREWRDYAGSHDSSRFVAATQITKDNVKQLAVAWNYPAGETDFNPIVVRNIVYSRHKDGGFVAVDAASGREIWVSEKVPGFNVRGFNYWESRDGKDRRLLFSSLTHSRLGH